MVARAIAPMAGVTASHKPIVTTMDVMYPKGRIPTLWATAPAISINTQALTKKAGPALNILKKSFIALPRANLTAPTRLIRCFGGLGGYDLALQAVRRT